LKRILSAAALVALASVVIASNATAAPSKTTHDGKSLTLRLVMRDVGFNFLDNPPRQGFNAPPLIGDQFTFTADLFTRSGRRAGTFGATCMVARGGVHSLIICYGTYSLRGGQIMGIAKGSETNTTRIAVVGGTGVYAGVSGTALEVSRGEAGPTNVTINLRYP
jgi:hypothetical protein